jgi:hypothetical protein
MQVTFMRQKQGYGLGVTAFSVKKTVMSLRDETLSEDPGCIYRLLERFIEKSLEISRRYHFSIPRITSTAFINDSRLIEGCTGSVSSR